MSHTYHFPSLWTDKAHDAVVAERHDIALLFDATNCNPNGDPDTGNMPRLQPDTLRGLVTDVCIKRKVRNFWGLNPPASSGYGIFIKESAVLGDVIQNSHDALIARLCRELLGELQQQGFLLRETAQSLGDILSSIDTLDEKKRPDSPDKCAVYVANLCKGKFDCSQLHTRVLAAIETATNFPSECREALASYSITDEQRSDPEKAAKGIEKAALDAAPRGTKPAVKEALKRALEQASPAGILEKRFSKIEMERANRDALCETFVDVRTFGAVVSTDGPLKGSFYGQIRGPLQITFAESLDKILQLDFSITRCAVASKDEAEKQKSESSDNRTMGRKHAVPYGLYRCHIHFSPGFAAKTHFTYGDLDNFLFALTRCLGDYNVDGSSARPGGMRVVGLVDFQHTSALGNAPAHKVFDLVKVAGRKFTAVEAAAKGDASLEGKFMSSGSEFPGGLHDYTGSAPDGPLYTLTNNHGVVIGCSETKPAAKDGNDPSPTITARRLIWEIPAA